VPDSSAPRRPGWDEYFVNIARAVAERSDCRRRKVGAVLVDTGRRIVGTGYTGAPSGHPGCLEGACPRGLLSYDEVKEFSAYDSGPGRCISVHAEANALLYARPRPA
jgi:dCMP deaminase